MKAIYLFLGVALCTHCFAQQHKHFICSFYVVNDNSPNEALVRNELETTCETLVIGSGVATYTSTNNEYVEDKEEIVLARENIPNSPTIPSSEDGLTIQATSDIFLEDALTIEKGAEVLFEISSLNNSRTLESYQSIEANDNNVLNLDEADISIYPVPAKDLVYIEFQYQETTEARIQIYDLKGMIIDEQLVSVKSGNNKISIDVSKLETHQTALFSLLIMNSGKEIRGKIIKV